MFEHNVNSQTISEQWTEIIMAKLQDCRAVLLAY